MSGKAQRLIWLNFLGEEAWRSWSLPFAAPWKRQAVAAWDELGLLLADPDDVYLSRVQPPEAWSEERLKQWPLVDSHRIRRVQFEDFTSARINSQNLHSEFVFVQVSPDEMNLISNLDRKLMEQLRAWNDKRHWPNWVLAKGYQTPESWKLLDQEIVPTASSCGRLKLAWSSGGAGQVVWRTPDEYTELRRAYLGIGAPHSQGISSIIPADEWMAQREIESPVRHWTLSFHLFDAFAPVAAQVTYDAEFHSVQHQLMSQDSSPIELRKFAEIWKAALVNDFGDSRGKWSNAFGFDAIEDSQGNFWIVDLNARLDRVGLMAWISERHGLRQQGRQGHSEFALPLLSRWRGLVLAQSREDLAGEFLRDFSDWNLRTCGGATGQSQSRIFHLGIVDTVINSSQHSQIRDFAVEVQVLHTAVQDAAGWMRGWFEQRMRR